MTAFFAMRAMGTMRMMGTLMMMDPMGIESGDGNQADG